MPVEFRGARISMRGSEVGRRGLSMTRDGSEKARVVAICDVVRLGNSGQRFRGRLRARLNRRPSGSELRHGRCFFGRDALLFEAWGAKVGVSRLQGAVSCDPRLSTSCSHGGASAAKQRKAEAAGGRAELGPTQTPFPPPRPRE